MISKTAMLSIALIETVFALSTQAAGTCPEEIPISAELISVYPGVDTWRLYVEMPNATDKVLAVSGDSLVSRLEFKAESDLLQYEVVPDLLIGDTPNQEVVLPGDSWVTIGDEITEDTLFSPGFLGGDGISSVINGSYWMSPDNRGYFDSNPFTGEFGRTLIAQFSLTTGSNFRYLGTLSYNCQDEVLEKASFRFSTDVADCDGDGEEDWVEILDGIEADCDQNGLPDGCEEDCDGDGVIDACDPDDDDDGILDECDSDSCGALGTGVFQVAGGWFHTIGLREDGTIACWGSNSAGQCDSPGGLFTQVAGGGYYTIGLREDGTIACWGNNSYGQCDAPDGVFMQVAGSWGHTIGLREDGTIACWGFNVSGQCDAPGGVFTQVAAGISDHSLGLREDGTIACWGDNFYGQCDAPDGVFTQIAGGFDHSIGLREDGTIACWGRNSDGQCDAPDGVFTQVAAGLHHSIGLREDGTIACWGYNFYGQCDAPDGVFTQIAAGHSHSIGLREDGIIAGWGRNDFGQCDVPEDFQFPPIALGDCDGNGKLDSCDLSEGAPDCNNNGVLDSCDIAGGASDCNSNGVPDECEPLTDCNGNGTPDECESFNDCNGNAIPDECEIDGNDCDGNGVPDECQSDCDNNNIPDACEEDCNSDGTPDNCQSLPDCNANSIPDVCESFEDCNANQIPDECEIEANDCDSNGVLDECDPDCDGDNVPDACDDDDDDDGIEDECDADSCGLTDLDCDENGRSDRCEIQDDPSLDCDLDGYLDSCTLIEDPSTDCDQDGFLDFCQTTINPEIDCDANLLPDVCDLEDGGLDEDFNGTLDRCQCGDVGVTLPHPSPIAGECFGRSVDIDGPRIVVGVRDGEACYVYRQEASGWVFEDFLISEDLDNDGVPDVAGFTNGWGQAVKIAGDSVAVGARLYNIPGTPPQFNAGIVVTFRFDNGSWVEDARLSPPGQSGTDAFGQSLDFEQTVLVASAPGADDAADGAGEIHVFTRSIFDGWAWEEVYRPEGLQSGDRYGAAVAVDGSLFVASATRDDDQGSQSGVLYLSDRSSGTLAPAGVLYSPDPWPFQEYGTALDVQDGRIAAGAPFDNQFGQGRGLVGIHEQDDSGNWVSTLIRPNAPQNLAYFGASVALEGDFLVVGAPGDDQNPQLDPPPGAIFIFERLALGEWIQRRRIVLPTYPTGELGLASAIDNGRIVAGALYDDRYGEDAGLARVFDLLPGLDCDENGLCDLSQIFTPDFDCNLNGVVDACELDDSTDCDGNAVLDVCELEGRDCDDNGILDVCDIVENGGDSNCDGVLDTCQCVGDLNGSGVISFEDLVILISAWGNLCPDGCADDLNCNGVVDSGDLLIILSRWGVCDG